MSVMLNPGDDAPSFKLADQQGELLGLSDYFGTKLMVFFYSKAMTSG